MELLCHGSTNTATGAGNQSDSTVESGRPFHIHGVHSKERGRKNKSNPSSLMHGVESVLGKYKKAAMHPVGDIAASFRKLTL
jgi:hypothetical protein